MDTAADASQSVLLESLDSGVLTLTLNRPERHNALNLAMHEALAAAIGRAAANEECRVVLLTGAGKGFCAGQDLSERAIAPGEGRPDLGESIDKRYNPLIRALRALPKPVVCAVNGGAAGAGANVALACDIVLAAKSAKFLQAFARIGLVPDSGGTWFLPRLVGDARARALMMLAEPIGAAEAEAWGMIYRAIDDDELMGTARELARAARRRADPRLRADQARPRRFARQQSRRAARSRARPSARGRRGGRICRRRAGLSGKAAGELPGKRACA